MSRNSMVARCAPMARGDLVKTFMPSTTGVAQAGRGLRAFTGTPSISMLTRSSAMQVRLVRAAYAGERSHSVAREAAAAVIDHVFELVPVMLEKALHRPGRGIPERTDGVPLYAVRDIEQQRK